MKSEWGKKKVILVCLSKQSKSIRDCGIEALSCNAAITSLINSNAKRADNKQHTPSPYANRQTRTFRNHS